MEHQSDDGVKKSDEHHHPAAFHFPLLKLIPIGFATGEPDRAYVTLAVLKWSDPTFSCH